MLKINEIAAMLKLSPDDIIPRDTYIAKLSPETTRRVRDMRRGKLILVTAASPTRAGEGKTTVSIGLADGMRKIGLNAMVALREPSLGPCFGMKGGATGGGATMVQPFDKINLHFTGDIHAITSANNLLCAMIDNHIHFGNELGITRIYPMRCMDMNDRALRDIEIGRGRGNGPVRNDGFIITVATEVMASLCLARDIAELQRMCGNILIGENATGDFIYARDICAEGAMAALLSDAILPNLVQTSAGTPALIHGGPFANIAHGCNSIVATESALGLADFVVTEAGFGADLGGEKFFDIKCRRAGLCPDAVVLVATPQSITENGGTDNLARHIKNMQSFGAPVVVALNFADNATADEIKKLREFAVGRGCGFGVARGFSDGADGMTDLARAVADATEQKSEIKLLYPDDMPIADKVRTVAQKIYGAGNVIFSDIARENIAKFTERGYGHLPVCIAKTQYSFTDDEKITGAPTGFSFHIRNAILYSGAGMVVLEAGNIMRMPGLPRRPAAKQIGVDIYGHITGMVH